MTVVSVAFLVITSLLLGWAGFRFWAQPRIARLSREKLQAEGKWKNLAERIGRERANLQALRALDRTEDTPSDWAQDLDELTRLLPEDSYLVGLRWDGDSIQIDLITPHPELIREVLAASSRFREVRFVGNLERKADKSRLQMQMRAERNR